MPGRHLGALMLLPLTACATPSVAPPVSEATQCHTEGLARFVGQKATADLGAEALKTSGARILRWAAPNTAQTMDFRPDRLTVRYDEAMVVMSARCG